MARWITVSWVLLFTHALGCAPLHAEDKAALRARCIQAIDASGARVGGGKLAESAIDLADSGFLFQFEEPGVDNWDRQAVLLKLDPAVAPAPAR